MALKAGLGDEEGRVGLEMGGGTFLGPAMSILPTGI